MENYEEDYDLNLSPSNKYGDDDDDDTPTGGFKSSQNKSSKTP